MGRNNAATPAQARRNTLGEMIRARGESKYNIWVVRPPFEEEDILLSSDSAMELFYFIEGDARFEKISYAPLRRAKDKDLVDRQGLEFAHVQTSKGDRYQVFLSRVRSSTAPNDSPLTGADGRIMIGLADLDANAQRVENWRRIVPCIRRVRQHATAALERQILLALRAGDQRSIRQIAHALPDCQAALLVGSIATLLRERSVISDCDTRPWSLNTLLCGAES